VYREPEAKTVSGVNRHGPSRPPPGSAPVRDRARGLRSYLPVLQRISDVAANNHGLTAGLQDRGREIRTSLYLREGIPPGKCLERPETGRAFLAAVADSGR
jgi:hypothetical protein